MRSSNFIDYLSNLFSHCIILTYLTMLFNNSLFMNVIGHPDEKFRVPNTQYQLPVARAQFFIHRMAKHRKVCNLAYHYTD